MNNPDDTYIYTYYVLYTGRYIPSPYRIIPTVESRRNTLKAQVVVGEWLQAGGHYHNSLWEAASLYIYSILAEQENSPE